jgi:hypothetical protein
VKSGYTLRADLALHVVKNFLMCVLQFDNLIGRLLIFQNELCIIFEAKKL